MHATRRARSPISVLVILMAVGATACSSGGPPVPVPAASGPLLTVETRGGLCASAPCGSLLTIERDGRVHVAAKPPNDLGTVPADQLAGLDSAIRSTDFAALKSHPFTGVCPTAYDGQELVFEFGALGGPQRVATCEVAVDYGSPLFVAVSTALGPFLALPTS